MGDSRGNEILNQMDYKSPIMKWYNNGILKAAVEMAELRGGEQVLDFGCSYQKQLAKFLNVPVHYVGYDIVPAWSGIKDYRTIKADVVFALNVLEHLYSKEELQKILKNFRAIGAKKVIVALPSENYVEYLLRIVLRREAEDFFEHTLPSKQAALELVKEYGMPKKYRGYRFLQILARFDLKWVKSH